MAEISNGVPTPYRGPSGIARESLWLTAEDLTEGTDTILTVEDVIARKDVVYQGGRKKPMALTLKFKGRQRELALNATNRKRMNVLFGYETAGWVGKTIALFVDPNVLMAGETVRAVRIRSTLPKAEGVK
jgi:hypothetical protein